MLYVWYFNVVNIGSNLKTTSLNSLKIIKKSPITEYSVQWKAISEFQPGQLSGNVEVLPRCVTLG